MITAKLKLLPIIWKNAKCLAQSFRGFASHTPWAAKFLTEPVPTAKDYEEAALWASAAPDHCRLHPVRFVIIRKPRQARRTSSEAVRFPWGRMPKKPAKHAAKPTKAPAVVAAIANQHGHGPCPGIRTVMTVGRCVSNFLSAAGNQRIRRQDRERDPAPNTRMRLEPSAEKDEVIACLDHARYT